MHEDYYQTERPATARRQKSGRRSGRTLTALIEDALREKLAQRARNPERKRIKLLTVPGGPLPGVDIDNSAALLDLMEAPDDSSRR